MIFSLPWPPSANRYWRNYGAGRVVVSEQARRYRVEALAALIRQDIPRARTTARLRVFLTLHPPNRRAWDLDNRIKQVLDALEDAGLYADDEQIDELHAYRGEVIKDRPRVDVRIGIIG